MGTTYDHIKYKPKNLWHRDGRVAFCDNLDKENELKAQGFTKTYQHSDWPKFIGYKFGRAVVVRDEDERMKFMEDPEFEPYPPQGREESLAVARAAASERERGEIPAPRERV